MLSIDDAESGTTYTYGTTEEGVPMDVKDVSSGLCYTATASVSYAQGEGKPDNLGDIQDTDEYHVVAGTKNASANLNAKWMFYWGYSSGSLGLAEDTAEDDARTAIQTAMADTDNATFNTWNNKSTTTFQVTIPDGSQSFLFMLPVNSGRTLESLKQEGTGADVFPQMFELTSTVDMDPNGSGSFDEYRVYVRNFDQPIIGDAVLNVALA